MYKALKTELTVVLEELKRISTAGEIRDELLQDIQLITWTLYGMKEESE